MINQWNQIQVEVTDFADEKFGNPTNPLPPLYHLEKEVKELIENPYYGMEYANCMILLIQAARRAGIKMDLLLKFVKDKHEINQTLTWGPPDENGVCEHIKTIKEVS